MQVKVTVNAKSRRETIDTLDAGGFKICVKEQALGNRANVRVQQLIAEHFNVPVTSVRFINGRRSTRKTFEIVQ